MDDIRFIIDFAQRGQLDKIIRDLERTNILMEKNIELQGEQGNAVQRAASDFDSYSRKLEEISKKLQLSADAKQFVALTAEIARLKKEYDELSKSVEGINEKKKKQKELTDAEILAQERLRASMNARRKAAREQIKDEEALNYTIETQTRSIEELRKKNNALVRQRERLDTTTREGREQFDRLTVAIRENERALLENDQAIGRHQRNVGNYRSALDGLRGTLLSLAAGFSVFAVIGDAARTISQFEDALKELGSITGLQGAELDKLGDRAIEMSKKFGTSATDILKGFQLVGSKQPQLLENADALAEVTAQAEILSKAAGISLPDAADALTKAMNQYGASAFEAASFTDILATSQQKGTATIASLSESLKNVGSVAKASNLSFETTNALLQGLAKGGLEGAEAGTKLRTILLRLAKTGRADLNPAVTDMSQILDTLSKEIPDVTAAQKMFGEEAAAAALTLIDQRSVVRDLNGALNEHGNALKQAENNTDTLSGQTARLGAAWDAFVLSIESGDGIIGRVIRNAISFFTNLLEVVSNLDKSVEQAVFERTSKRISELKEQSAKESIQIILDLENYSKSQLELLLNNEDARVRGAAQLRLTLLEKGVEAEEATFKILTGLRKQAAEENEKLWKDRARLINEGTKEEQKNAAGLFNLNKKFIEQIDLYLAKTKIVTEEENDRLTNTTDKTKELLKVTRELIAAQIKEKESTDKERMDQELRDLDAQAKRRKTVLIEEITDEEQLRAEQYDLERQLLENKIAVVEKYEGDATDLKLQLAELEYQRKKEIADREMKDKQDRDAQKKRDDEKALEEEKKREDLRREFIKDTMEIALSALNEEAEKRIELASEAVDKQKQNIDIQRELAAQGLENTLAFEKELAAQKERELLEAQKRAERIKKIEAYYNLVASYAETDPNTAPAKALIQMTIAEAIAGRFEHGGIVAEEIAKQNKGILRGPSHRNGGILIEAEGDEGIFSRKEMARLGRDRFHAIKDALNSPNSHLDIKSANEDVAMAMIPVQQKVDIEPLRKEMQEVKRAIEDKPVPMFIIDRNGNLITKQQAKNQIRYTVQKNKGFN